MKMETMNGLGIVQNAYQNLENDIMTNKITKGFNEIYPDQRYITYCEKIGMLETEHALGLALLKGKKTYIYAMDYEELIDLQKLIDGQISRIKPWTDESLSKLGK